MWISAPPAPKKHLLFNCSTPNLSATGSRLQKMPSSHWGCFQPHIICSTPRWRKGTLTHTIGSPDHNGWAGSPRRNRQMVGHPPPTPSPGDALPCVPGSLQKCWTTCPCVPLLPLHLSLLEWQCCCHYPDPFHHLGQVIYLIVLLFVHRPLHQEGHIRPYWETAMHHLQIQEYSTKHSSNGSRCSLPNPTSVFPFAPNNGARDFQLNPE